RLQKLRSDALVVARNDARRGAEADRLPRHARRQEEPIEPQAEVGRRENARRSVPRELRADWSALIQSRYRRDSYELEGRRIDGLRGGVARVAAPNCEKKAEKR